MVDIEMLLDCDSRLLSGCVSFTITIVDFDADNEPRSHVESALYVNRAISIGIFRLQLKCWMMCNGSAQHCSIVH